MSQLGHSRRFDAPPVTSGPPQSTDIARPAPLVRFVPIGDIASIQLLRQLGRVMSSELPLLEGKVVHIPDVRADPEYTFFEAQRRGRLGTVLSLPAARGGS